MTTDEVLSEINALETLINLKIQELLAKPYIVSISVDVEELNKVIILGAIDVKKVSQYNQ